VRIITDGEEKFFLRKEQQNFSLHHQVKKIEPIIESIKKAIEASCTNSSLIIILYDVYFIDKKGNYVLFVLFGIDYFEFNLQG